MGYRFDETFLHLCLWCIILRKFIVLTMFLVGKLLLFTLLKFGSLSGLEILSAVA
ncbi:hypothetical protein H4Q32_020005 [Labeo rohita]|uniref:Uncharacterized protein n=1 Tax=Labeo rohita TaxID=84645 RepID=A0ABQ8LDR8_LABRO|nr:hypothetical protein H4Q32_020005 [Labeo rohita]